MIQTADLKWNKNNTLILRSIRNKLIHFEDELPKLKEVTSILELVLWKMKIIENSSLAPRWKKIKSKRTSKQQCRVTCGADIVIQHVLPFLL
jgi:hypothetical protein